MQKHLEGFHISITYRMVRKSKPCQMSKPRQDVEVPAKPHVLEEACVCPIAHYMKVRRLIIAKFIVNRPILYFCREGGQRRETSPCQWWWDQSMGLCAVSDGAIAPAVATNKPIMSFITAHRGGGKKVVHFRWFLCWQGIDRVVIAGGCGRRRCIPWSSLVAGHCFHSLLVVVTFSQFEF